jgi:hypothetical protein
MAVWPFRTLPDSRGKCAYFWSLYNRSSLVLERAFVVGGGVQSGGGKPQRPRFRDFFFFFLCLAPPPPGGNTGFLCTLPAKENKNLNTHSERFLAYLTCLCSFRRCSRAKDLATRNWKSCTARCIMSAESASTGRQCTITAGVNISSDKTKSIMDCFHLIFSDYM